MGNYVWPEELGLTDEEKAAKKWGQEQPEDTDAGPDEVAEGSAVYEGWSYQDLQTEAATRGLKANGSKDDIAARLREDDEYRLAQNPGQ